MCGIIGAVGKSKNPIVSYNLLTNLMIQTERRGKHASGFYAINYKDEVDYHKYPIASSNYVKQIEWQRNVLGTKAIIGHCRFTTAGSASNNVNNHPFISNNGNIGFIHNGIIHDYDDVKEKYDKSLVSECDSELILRVICREKDIPTGIKKVFELFGSKGDFACELIHYRKEGGHKFYFFRDVGRPGKMIDLREEFGQIFFCSESKIWQDAVSKSGLNDLLGTARIEDIEPYQIICVNTSTLEVNCTEVKKPIRVPASVAHKTYRSYMQDSQYTPKRSPFVNSKYNHLFDAEAIIKSSRWSESINKLGLPRVEYNMEE